MQGAPHVFETSPTHRLSEGSAAAVAASHSDMRARPAFAAPDVAVRPRRLNTHAWFPVTALPVGGIVCAASMVELLRPRLSQPLSVVARWLVEHRVLSISWHGETLLPTFQFDRDLQPWPAVERVLEEFDAVFDEWRTLEWFMEPNPWLGMRRPAELLESDEELVLQVARGDRFVAVGP